MTYTIQYHPQTALDLLQITQWLIEYASVDTAERRVVQITDSIRGLADFPYRGSPRDEIAAGLKIISAADQNAVVTYTVSDEFREILIVAISYAGGDWMSMSRTRLKR